MFKILLALVASFFFCSIANAGLTTSAGVIYSMRDHALSHVETVQAIKAFKYLSVDVGYAGDADEVDNRIVGAITADIDALKMSKYVQIPILDLVSFRPGMYAGLGDINLQNLSGAKFDWGFALTVLSYKF